MPETTDVAIVGAGIVGCSAALELAAAGLRVTVFEEKGPGAGATRAAAGILSSQSDAEGPGPLLALGLAARETYPQLAEELRSETGIDVGYRTRGTIVLALDSGDEAELEHRYEWQSMAGLPVERLPAGRIHVLEPQVNRAVRQGLLFPLDHQLDNILLIQALSALAGARGVTFRLGRRVEAVEESGGRVAGLRLAGERVRAGQVVIAAGCWSGQIQGLPEKIPVMPVRGQMLALDPDATIIEHVLFHSGRYLVPRWNGRLLVGSTLERAGFDATVTAGGIGRLISHALDIVPGLKDARIREAWAGLRPGTEDGLPIIGRSSLSGLFYATGLFRSGILLGPLTGKLIAQLLLHGRASHSLQPFDPLRFTPASR